MNFKASNYHFNSSRTSTLKDINSSRTSKDYITLRCNGKDIDSSRTTLQGHRLYYKDYIDSSRTTSLFAAIKDIDSSRT